MPQLKTKSCELDHLNPMLFGHCLL